MNNKGFTLVELLATIAILGILLTIGFMVVNNITDNTKISYYKSEENTLAIAGNEYFNDNRDDKPIDDYNFVDLKTLQEHEYLEELKTHDGKELCSEESGVYIYNDNGTSYETCLICGDYRSPGPFCNGKRMGTIKISGNVNTPDGPAYNPLLSYSGASWVNASTVYIHFGYEDEEGQTVTSYKVYNGSSSTLYGECTRISNNNCTMEIPTTGSYYVEAYGAGGKIGSRKYFNVKLDNVKPKYDVAKGDEDILLKDDEIYYNYENEILNINDDNGYKSVTYTLTRYNPTYPASTQIIAQDVDIKDKDLKISQKLASGRYDLYITVKDFAGNIGESSRSQIRFYIKYKVDLKYYDIYDKQHDAGNIEVYTYGKYEQVKSTNVNGTYQETTEKSLPRTLTISGHESEPITWYKDANFSGTAVSSATLVSSTGYHSLYGKESRKTTKFTSECIKKDGKNLVYNMDDQQLVTEGTGYSLVVYYGNTKTNNLGHDAGTYTVIAVLDSLYQWEDGTRANKYVQCIIDPAPVTVPSCKNPTYNGYYQELVSGVGDNILYHDGVPTSLPHDAELNSYNPGKEIDFIIHGPFGKSAGPYTVTFTLTGTNYIWNDNTNGEKKINCTINPLATKVEWSNLTFTYDGKSHAPTATATSALSYYTIKFDVTDAINADTHNTEATCNSVSSSLKGEGDSCSNYTFSNTSSKFTINKKSIAVVWSTPYTMTYNGGEQAPPASVSTGVSGETMTLSTTKATNVHSSWSQSVYPYVSTAKCSKVTGGQADCNNYSLTNTTHGFNILPKAVTITSDSDTKQYDGTALTKKSVTGSGLVSGHTAEGNVTGSQTIVGSSNNTVTGCKVKSGSTDVSSNYTITCSAGKLTVTPGTATICSCNTNATANGSDTICTGGSHISASPNTTTTSGENTVTVTANTYYQFSDGKTSKTVKCTVKVPCTYQWVEVGTTWDVSNCSTASDDENIKYECVGYTGSPWTSTVNEQCIGSTPFTTAVTGTYDSKQAALDACNSGASTICAQDCGTGYVKTCSCSASGTSKTKKVKYEWQCV